MRNCAKWHLTSTFMCHPTAAVNWKIVMSLDQIDKLRWIFLERAADLAVFGMRSYRMVRSSAVRALEKDVQHYSC